MNLLFINIGSVEILVVLLPIFAVWIYTFYHISTNKTLSGYQKNLWYLFVLIGSGLGFLAYWVFGKNGELKNKQTV